MVKPLYRWRYINYVITLTGVVGTQIVNTYLNIVYKQNHSQETWILETEPARDASLELTRTCY